MTARTSLKLLLVEDQVHDAGLITAELQKAGYELAWKRVDTEVEYTAALASDLDVVLCDHALPQFNSQHALKILKASYPDIPFIIVSGRMGEEYAVEAMRRGADDYLLKDRLARLGGAVAAALERRRLRATARNTVERLRESEERHRIFLENSPAVMFMKDTAGRYLHVNREFTRAFGVDASAVIGRCDAELFPPEQAAAFGANDRAALESGAPKRFEEKALYIDGPHTTIVVKFPLSDSQGKVYGIGGIATDITGRMESEARYRATFDQAAVGICHFAPSGRFITVNDRLCEILGYSREEFLQRTFQELSHPADLAGNVALRDSMLAEPARRHSPEIQSRCIRGNGALLWVSVTISTVLNASGEVDYFVAMVQDISERKNAEERFRATFEQAAVGIAHTSLDSRYLMVNEKFCAMTGYTRDELLEMHTFEIIHPDDLRRTPERALLLENKLQTYSSERRYLRKDGTTIWVNRTVSLVRDAGGMPLYFLRVVEDVTERKRAQAGAALLQSTTLAIGQAQDMDHALRIVLQRICESTGWRFGQAWVPSADGNALECRVGWHDGSAALEAFHRGQRQLAFDETPGLVIPAFRSKEPRWVPDIAAVDFDRRESALAAGFEAWAGIPVLADGKAVALLEFFMQVRQIHDQSLVDLVAVVATQLGLLFRRKAAEDSWRESDERFRQLAAHIPEVFWMTDAT
ncbi:MAG TPA: PAS domain S-box protein, partial [Burkholderiales bacterium]|nr:PAS domain S-box protein [Burkholderiales bacterium]